MMGWGGWVFVLDVTLVGSVGNIICYDGHIGDITQKRPFGEFSRAQTSPEKIQVDMWLSYRTGTGAHPARSAHSGYGPTGRMYGD